MATQAYMHVYNTLRAQIVNLEYREGDQLPTESQLCEILGVSRITVRRAMDMLTQDGLIKRKPGSGTFVLPANSRKVPIFLNDFSGSIENQAPNMKRKLVSREVAQAPSSVVTSLDLPPQTPCLIAQRQDIVENEPVAFDRLYIPEGLTRSIHDLMLMRIDFLDVWLESAGLTMSHYTESIEVVEVGRNAAKLLQLSPGTPVLLTVDIVYDTNGKAVGRFDSFYRTDRFKLVSTFSVDSNMKSRELRS